MIPYAAIVFVAVVGDWILNRTADLLNLGALRAAPPAELAHLHDAGSYARAQEYTRAGIRLGIVAATVDLATLLLFWGADGFRRLDDAARAVGVGPIATGLVYIGTLLLARAVLALPLRIYSTFVLEARFGFNRTTARTFLADLGKTLGLSVALGGPVLVTVLYFFTHAGPHAWLYAWLTTTAVALGLQYVAPTWILPLFNTFTPLADGPLRRRILDYALAVKFPVADIFVIDGSRRSSKANAFFTGIGRTKRIALFDTLVRGQSIDQVVGVVAHEIGHYKLKHVPAQSAFGIAHSGALFALLSFFLYSDALFHAFGIVDRPVHVGIVLFGLLYTPIEVALGLVLNGVSRRFEYAADRFAAETTGRPDLLAAALAQLSNEQLANLTPHPLYVALHYSHPPIVARLRALGGNSTTATAAARDPTARPSGETTSSTKAASGQAPASAKTAT